MTSYPENEKEYVQLISIALKKFCNVWDLKIELGRILTLAEITFSNYVNESILDILKATRNGTEGKHGTTYNSLTPATINHWMELHLQQKYEAKETNLLKYKQDKEPLQDVDYEAYKKRTDDGQDKIDKTVKLIRDRRQESNE